MGPGSNGPDELSARRERDVAALLSQISYLEEEIGLLRRKVADSPVSYTHLTLPTILLV